MKQESKRHHYIPQFILRNFQDENSQVSYWDIENSKLEKRNTRSVFMNMNMYRDEINHQDNPTSIESTLAVFEQEIAELIKGKFLTSNEVVITREELEKLRIFLSLLSFRSNSRMEQYRNSNFSAKIIQKSKLKSENAFNETSDTIPKITENAVIKIPLTLFLVFSISPV